MNNFFETLETNFRPQFQYSHLRTETARAVSKQFCDIAELFLSKTAQSTQPLMEYIFEVLQQMHEIADKFYESFGKPRTNYSSFLIEQKLVYLPNYFLREKHHHVVIKNDFERFEYKLLQLLLEAKDIAVRADIVANPIK